MFGVSSVSSCTVSFGSWRVMFIGVFCLFLLRLLFCGLFRRETGGLSRICLVFRYRGSWGKALCVICKRCILDVEGFVVDDVPLGLFIILSRTYDFFTWLAVWLLALFRKVSFFYFINSKVQFGLIVSFISIVSECRCICECGVSCDSNTSNLLLVGIFTIGKLSAEFMISFFRLYASPIVLSSLLLHSLLLSALLFLFTRFRGGLSFRIF